VQEQTTYIIQVNGRVRARFDFAKGASKELIASHAQKDPQVLKHLTGEIEKLVFVPDKLLNFVTIAK
jgi:leucyl-tRNA synthetase